MNREEAKRLLPIISQFADGLAVEYRTFDGTWIACSDDVVFRGDPSDYRIKPKPMEVRVIFSTQGDPVGVAFPDSPVIPYLRNSKNLGETKLFREVIE